MEVEAEAASGPSTATPAEEFGRYRLMDLLGEGGMGRVYRAYDTTTERAVALKVLSPQLAKDRVFQQRFRREAEVAARLADPHIVPIHQYGEIDGRLYVDMRLIEGDDLGTVIARTGPLRPERAVAIVEQVADALAAAHGQGLVHRDIKPSNILLTRHDFAYLIDFGIAWVADQTRMTSAGSAIGTFAYMSPERFSSSEADRRWDVYALACVLYECLTGRQPFPGESLPQQIAAHITVPPPRPSQNQDGVPETFDDVIATGMAKNPVLRHQSAHALAEAARAALPVDDPVPEVTVSHRLPEIDVVSPAAEAPPTQEIHETLLAIPTPVEQEPVEAAEPEPKPEPARPEPEPEPEPEAEAATYQDHAQAAEPAPETLPVIPAPVVSLTKRSPAEPTAERTRTPESAPEKPPAPEREETRPRRRPMLVAAVALFVLLAGGGIAAATMGGETEPPPATPDVTETTPQLSTTTAVSTTRTTTPTSTPSTTTTTPTRSAATISTPAPAPTFTPTQTQAPAPVVTQEPAPVEEPPPVTQSPVPVETFVPPPSPTPEPVPGFDSGDGGFTPIVTQPQPAPPPPPP